MIDDIGNSTECVKFHVYIGIEDMVSRILPSSFANRLHMFRGLLRHVHFRTNIRCQTSLSRHSTSNHSLMTCPLNPTIHNTGLRRFSSLPSDDEKKRALEQFMVSKLISYPRIHRCIRNMRKFPEYVCFLNPHTLRGLPPYSDAHQVHFATYLSSSSRKRMQVLSNVTSSTPKRRNASLTVSRRQCFSLRHGL